MMERPGLYIRRHSRTAAAIAFGCKTMVVTHLAWFPDARMNGYVPVLTVAVGLCHALAGIVIGRRIIDTTSTQTSSQACVLGACTSLLAMAFLAPPFALWISLTNARPEGAFSNLFLSFLIGLFSFLAVGWALLLVSAGVGWALYRLTISRATK